MEGYLHDLQRGLYSLILSWDGSESKVDMHRANEVREIMGPWTELPVTPKHQLLVRQKFGNRGGIEMEERGAVAPWRRRRRN